MTLAVTSLAEFSVIVVIIVGVLTIVGTVSRTVTKIVRAILTLVEATRENTTAIEKLSGRVTRLEQRVAEG
jgi:hypothetical protein